nr:hypothetical protein GCM10025730_02630 [Promicromonospora thailandica]
MPVGWETEWAGWTVTFATLVPLAVVGGYFVLLVVYPWLEAWIDQDRLPHDVLDRPRNVPARTGIGVAGALFYGILWGAASADIVATEFSVSFEAIITTLQVALVVGPPLAFEVTRRICVGLQRKDREVLLHGHETGRIVRLPNGGYVEVHQPASGVERARLGVEVAPTGREARAGVARVVGATPVGAAPVEAAPVAATPVGVGLARDTSARETPESVPEAHRSSRRAGRVTARDRVRGSLGRGFGVGHVVPRTTTEEQTEPQPADGPARPDGAATLDGASRSDRPAEPDWTARPAPPAPAGPPDRRTPTEAAGRDVA